MLTLKEKKPKSSLSRGFQTSKYFQPFSTQNKISTAKLLPEALSNFDTEGGLPLPSDILLRMESLFNANFSDIRIHIGPQASSIGAIAFACGSDLFFAPGMYNPYTKAGLQLLGHELTHVLQQREGRVKNPFGKGIAIVQDDTMEAEADLMGLKASRPESLNITYINAAEREIITRQKGTVIQCVLTFHKKMSGPNGEKDIYVEGGIYYFKSTMARTDGKDAWRAVIFEGERYKLSGGADLLIDKAPVVPTGWSAAKVVNAFKTGGPMPIRIFPAVLDFEEVHATTNVNSTKEYPQFHVKFDTGTRHISAFYPYPAGVFHHFGQNKKDLKSIIDEHTGDESEDNFNNQMTLIRAEADKIALELRNLLN